MQQIGQAIERIERVIAAGPYGADWNSLAHYQIPEWYENAKFGIFIHWGVYSVPAFGNEWYPRNMYIPSDPAFQHHIETYGPHTQFGYKDFIPMFKAEQFDADKWAVLFKQSGAQYVIPVAEHHDGFAMYDSEYTEWTAVKKGPKRDVIGQLEQAVRRQGLNFGLSSHREENWWFFHEGTGFDSDVNDPQYAGLYGPAQPKTLQPNEEFLDEWLVRCCELVDKYRPRIVWFDWWISQPAFVPYLQRFAAYYYNRAAQWKSGVVINYKHQAFPLGCAIFDVERDQLPGIRPQLWQTDTSINRNSWGYAAAGDYKEAGQLIRDLIDIVSKNGVMLLNIGPKADGTIAAPEEEALRAIGAWLMVNGEAIYNTRPWVVYGEGPTRITTGSLRADNEVRVFTSQDIRFTCVTGATVSKGIAKNMLYAIVMDWPADNRVVIKSLSSNLRLLTGHVERVDLLGGRQALSYSQTDDGLVVELPENRPCPHAFALRLCVA